MSEVFVCCLIPFDRSFPFLCDIGFLSYFCQFPFSSPSILFLGGKAIYALPLTIPFLCYPTPTTAPLWKAPVLIIPLLCFPIPNTNCCLICKALSIYTLGNQPHFVLTLQLQFWFCNLLSKTLYISYNLDRR